MNRKMLLLLQKERGEDGKPPFDRDLPSELFQDYMKHIGIVVEEDTPSSVDCDFDSATYYNSDIEIILADEAASLVVETNGESVLLSVHCGAVNYQRAFKPVNDDSTPYSLEMAMMVVAMGVNLNLPFNKMEWVFSNSLQGFIT